MKKLLLHICCAPCSTVPLERLKENYEIIGVFYNPNIYPEKEYKFRLKECRDFLETNGLKIIELDYDKSIWEKAIKGYEASPEGESRCKICYRVRLEKTASLAKEEGIEYFTTTLTISPHKNHKVINEIGTEIADKYNINFLSENFKKQDGFKQSCEISRNYDMYRQDYCGCEYSIRDNK